jgi:hypothetical protein
VAHDAQPAGKTDGGEDGCGDKFWVATAVMFVVKDVHGPRRFGRYFDPRLFGGFGDRGRFFPQAGTGSLVVDDFYLWVVDDVVAGLVEAVAEVNIFAVEEVILVPTAQFVEEIGRHHQVGTGRDLNPVNLVKVPVRLVITVKERAALEQPVEAGEVAEGNPGSWIATMIVRVTLAVGIDEPDR